MNQVRSSSEASINYRLIIGVGGLAVAIRPAGRNVREFEMHRVASYSFPPYFILWLSGYVFTVGVRYVHTRKVKSSQPRPSISAYCGHACALAALSPFPISAQVFPTSFPARRSFHRLAPCNQPLRDELFPTSRRSRSPISSSPRFPRRTRSSGSHTFWTSRGIFLSVLTDLPRIRILTIF